MVRPTISVSGAVKARLSAYSKANNISMSQLVEVLIFQVISGEQKIPGSAIARGRVGCRDRPVSEPAQIPTPVDQREDYIARHRDLAERVLAAHPADVLSTHVNIDISAVIAEALADQIERGRADGIELEMGEILDGALCRMLDAMAKIPWCRVCLETNAECRCVSLRAQAARR